MVLEEERQQKSGSPTPTIGLAKKLHGLYYFEIKEVKSSIISNFVHNWNNGQVTSSTILWHLRLRYLSQDKMKRLNHQYGLISIPTHTSCDVFYSSRKNKSYFPLSTSNANNVFNFYI